MTFCFKDGGVVTRLCKNFQSVFCTIFSAIFGSSWTTASNCADVFVLFRIFLQGFKLEIDYVHCSGSGSAGKGEGERSVRVHRERQRVSERSGGVFWPREEWRGFKFSARAPFFLRQSSTVICYSNFYRGNSAYEMIVIGWKFVYLRRIWSWYYQFSVRT